MLLISLLLSHLIELVENAHKKFLHRHRCGIFAPILLLFFVHFVFVFFLLCSVFFRWRPYNRIHRSVWLKWRMNESEDEKETKYKIKQCTEDLLTNDSTKTEWENWWTGIFVRIFVVVAFATSSYWTCCAQPWRWCVSVCVFFCCFLFRIFSSQFAEKPTGIHI